MAFELDGSVIIDDNRNVVAGVAATFSGRVNIGGSSEEGDATLLVKTPDLLHPAIKVDASGTNGFTLIADSYSATTSIANLGLSYSGAGVVLSRGVKVSNVADNTYLSSQASFSNKPQVLKLDDDGSFRFLNTDNAATTSVDTAVSLTERLRIKSNGNVGIGTIDPGVKLDVRGTSRFTDFVYGGFGGTLFINDSVALSPTKKLYFDMGSNTYIHEPTGDNLALVTGGTERLRIAETGYVGIGITNPEALLHLKAANPQLVVMDTDTTESATSATIRLANATASGQTSHYWNIKKEGTDLVFDDGQIGVGVDERLRIASNGRVGINTTVPTAPLNVQAETSTGTCVRLNQETTNKKASIYFQDATTTGNDSWITNEDTDLTVYAGYGGKLHLGAYQTTGITVLSTGKVGVGTNNPGYMLELYGTNSNNYLSFVNTTAADGDGNRYSRIVFRGTQSGGEVSSLSAINGSHDGAADDQKGRISFRTNDGSDGESPTERLRIDSSGHMGLGVTPNANWPTNGDFKALQIGTGLALFGRGSGDEDRGGIAANLYTDGSNYKYIGDGHAGRIYFEDGSIVFNNAGSAANSSGANAAATLVETLRIDSSGNVGIGTDNPDTNLHVEGTGTDILKIESHDAGAQGVNLIMQHSSASPAADDVISLIQFNGLDNSDNPTTYSSIRAVATAVENNSEKGDITFFTRNGGNFLEKVRIDSIGRLMVGSSTAKSVGMGQYGLIDIQGYAGSTGSEGILSISRGEAATTMSPNDEVGNITFTDSAGYEFARIQVAADAATGTTDTPGRLVFRTTTDGASSSTQRMIIDSNGDVGINTDDPGAQLHVQGSGSSSTLNILTTDSSGNNVFYAKDGGQVGLHYYPLVINQDTDDTATPSSTYFYVHHTSNPFIIKNDGNVGVGLTNPGAQLHLAGPSEIRLDNASDGGNYARIRCFEESSDNGAHIAFNTGAGEVVRFQNDGNVGIQSTTPSAVLDIGNTGIATATTMINANAWDGQVFNVDGNVTSDSTFSVNDISGLPVIDFNTTHSLLSLGAFGGNVSIGYTNAGTKLGLKGSTSERVYIVNDEITDVSSVNIDNGNVQYYDVKETDTSGFTVNITSNNTLNNDLVIGDSVNVVLIIISGGSTTKISEITIDGSAATEEWLGGSAPDGGADGTYDVYTFFILKTADATFLPLCNKVNFA